MNTSMKDFVFGAVVGIVIVVALVYSGVKFTYTPCKVKVCTEDGVLCVGEKYEIGKGIYKGNIGKITRIYEKSSWGYNGEYHRIEFTLCNGNTETYTYELGKENQITIINTEDSECN